jgi:predicted nuclease of restriction endonuclease-like RecB superfamily
LARGRPPGFSVRDGRVLPHWLAEQDQPWLRALIDEYERFVGRRRRELVERLREPLPRAAPPGKLALAARTLDGLYPSVKKPGLAPRQVRALVFAEATRAPPEETREAVLGRVSAGLHVAPGEVEEALLADLPGERRVGAPAKPVSPVELALRSNLALVQGLVRRASRVRIELEGSARAIVRHAKLRGLLGVVRPRPRAQDAALELSGPIALFRRTLLYGRALAELVPRLAWCQRFRLQAELELSGQRLLLELGTGDPFLPAGEPRRFDSRLEERFARDFARAAPAWDLVREPEPVEAEGTLIFPDFALQHRHEPARRWLLEILGFWTRDYVEQKLRRLRAAAIPRLILCVDEERNVGESELPAGALVVPFRRAIDVARVVALVEPG